MSSRRCHLGPLRAGSGLLAALCLAACGISDPELPEVEAPATETPPPQPVAPDPAPARPPHWSFVAPERPTVPSAARPDWVRNPIDHFVLERLLEAGLEPSGPAAPAALLRRAALDLTGLPPLPEDVLAFAADPSDEAYERYVEGWLGSPAFAEHRARFWLDVARYADTHGYHFDNYRSIWPYRDYVIEAFRSNKPFDVFTVEQLAGDLLPGASSGQRVATGFIRAGMSTNEGGVEKDEYAAIYAKDRVDTLAATWLGLSVGCAACHDHLYDPITQKEFYGLSAFFRNTTQPALDGNLADSPPSLRVGPDAVPTLVTEEQPGEPFAHVLERGRYDAPGERVPAGVPAALPPLPEGEPKNRLGLARWLTAPDHPLTARVTVNRFWSEVFGAGLLRTPNDFGRIGEAPSHPELLDWLAVEFRESGWDVKHLFRLLLTSATYRQTAAVGSDKYAADADNRLLARGPRFRMDAEMVRDLALAASELLVPVVGGPSVKPYQPPDVWEVVSLPESDTYRYEPESGDALYRRSLYTFWKRQAPPPSLEAFNAPNREQSVVQRERTNTPLQALVSLNDVQFIEAARTLATHALERAAGADERLEFMALRVLSRQLTAAESVVLEELLESERALYAAEPAAADALVHVGDSDPPAGLEGAELAAWTQVASSLLNLDEALTK